MGMQVDTQPQHHDRPPAYQELRESKNQVESPPPPYQDLVILSKLKSSSSFWLPTYALDIESNWSSLDNQENENRYPNEGAKKQSNNQRFKQVFGLVFIFLLLFFILISFGWIAL